MTASVVVSEPGSRAPADRSTRRPHGGRYDCGCGRGRCHDEFAALAATTDPPTRAVRRDRLVEAHLQLAYGIAGRYRRPGPGLDDLRQVAALALVEAVHRFDPDLGTAFSAFAVPTVTGAIKRYFRDQRWTLHPPRRTKELLLRIRAATDLLTQQLQRAPEVTDLARHLGCGEAEVREALCTGDAVRPLSLDAPVAATEEDSTLAATLGGPDAGYTRVEDVETLRPLLAELPERELRVITLRFAGNLTQSQIAERIGCSQMHISRILRTALDRLRRGMQGGPDRPRGTAGQARDAREGVAPRRPTHDARMRATAGRTTASRTTTSRTTTSRTTTSGAPARRTTASQAPASRTTASRAPASRATRPAPVRTGWPGSTRRTRGAPPSREPCRRPIRPARGPPGSGRPLPPDSTWRLGVWPRPQGKPRYG